MRNFKRCLSIENSYDDKFQKGRNRQLGRNKTIWPAGYFSAGQTVFKKAKFNLKFGRKKAKLATFILLS